MDARVAFLMQEEDAAKAIQRTARAKAGRRKAAARRQELENQGPVYHAEHDAAALKLQALARGKAGRRQAGKLDEARQAALPPPIVPPTPHEQRWTALKQERAQARDEAATQLQRVARGRAGRRRAAKQPEILAQQRKEALAAVKIQGMARSRAARIKVDAIRQERGQVLIETELRDMPTSPEPPPLPPRQQVSVFHQQAHLRDKLAQRKHYESEMLLGQDQRRQMGLAPVETTQRRMGARGHRSIVDEMLHAKERPMGALPPGLMDMDFGIRVPLPGVAHASQKRMSSAPGQQHRHPEEEEYLAEELFKMPTWLRGEVQRGAGDRHPSDPVFELGRQDHEARMRKKRHDTLAMQRQAENRQQGPRRAKTHLGHHSKKTRAVGNAGHVDFESRINAERHMEEYQKIKAAFEKPHRLPPVNQRATQRRSVEKPDLVWHHKNSFGMSIEVHNCT